MCVNFFSHVEGDSTCFWRQLGDCNREYEYQEGRKQQSEGGTLHHLNCADGLVFSEEKTTCVRCQDALRHDGSPCC